MKIYPDKLFFCFIAFALTMIPALSWGQTGGQSTDPELNKYNNTINFPKPPKVEIKNLGSRALLYHPEMKFVADNDIVISFDVLINPEGKVLYVRPHSCKAEFNEYRKGGINYLYASKFSSIPDSQGDQKYTAVFTFPGVEFPHFEE